MVANAATSLFAWVALVPGYSSCSKYLSSAAGLAGSVLSCEYGGWVALGVKLSWFFDDGDPVPTAERGVIVRAQRRKMLNLTGIGITDYLLGRVPLEKAIRKVAGTNLYIMPAGEAVINPLELLNLREVKLLLDRLPTLFNWVILDSPPLLFAADANLLSTLCHGTLLVVRIGHTTIDSVTRAMQSLCNNNVLGIVVNGARRGELYSKYTYYHSYYSPKDEDQADEDEPVAPAPASDEK